MGNTQQQNAPISMNNYNVQKINEDDVEKVNGGQRR